MTRSMLASSNRWASRSLRWAALSALLGGLAGLTSVSLAASGVGGDGWHRLVVAHTFTAATFLYLLGILGLYSALRIAHSGGYSSPKLATVGVVVIASSIICNLVVLVGTYVEGRDAFHWGRSWGEELFLYAASPFGASVGLALLGISAARERSFGALLRVLPLVAAALYPASIILNLLMNVAMGTQWEGYWPSGLLLYQPFLQSALLGCALLTAYAGGSSSTRYSRTS
jgi:hypothetical protein